MNFIADENLPAVIVERLRDDGHHVDWASQMAAGSSDSTILRLATESDSIIVTQDKDFGELVFQHGMAHSGVLFLRLAGLSNDAKALEVARAVEDLGDQLTGSFTTLSPDGWRISHP